METFDQIKTLVAIISGVVVSLFGGLYLVLQILDARTAKQNLSRDKRIEALEAKVAQHFDELLKLEEENHQITLKNSKMRSAIEITLNILSQVIVKANSSKVDFIKELERAKKTLSEGF